MDRMEWRVGGVSWALCGVGRSLCGAHRAVCGVDTAVWDISTVVSVWRRECVSGRCDVGGEKLGLNSAERSGAEREPYEIIPANG